MPVKRRNPKQRASAEAAAWATMFSSGWDFFRDLAPLSETDARAAAPQAWRQLGAAFMDGWRPSEARQTPWALETFGPPCR